MFISGQGELIRVTSLSLLASDCPISNQDLYHVTGH